METVIRTEALRVAYRIGPRKRRVALWGLDLEVFRGEIFGFLGPNGAGKTTTIHTLLGFVFPSSGGGWIFGKDILTPIARSRIGYLPETADYYRYLTGREILSMYGRLFGLGGRNLSLRVDEVLEITELGEAADLSLGSYSKGMLQRVGLAQALVNDPDLLILDEPTSGLDPPGRMKIRSLIRELKERGKTVFFSSHELSEVETVCDRVAILNRGRLVISGLLSDILRDRTESLEMFFLDLIGRGEG